MKRLVLVLDIDDGADSVGFMPFTPEKVDRFIAETPPEAKVVLVKVDGVTLYDANGG